MIFNVENTINGQQFTRCLNKAQRSPGGRNRHTNIFLDLILG